MFGYTLIKTTEIENLKAQLADIQITANTQAKRITDLENKINEQEMTIANLTKSTVADKSETTGENIEKPIKKIRRKSSKKNNKKEE